MYLGPRTTSRPHRFSIKLQDLKANNEVKVGIIGFVVLTTLLVTFNYLNRKNVFSRSLIISAQFDDLNFIRKGEIVFIKGREAGRVVAIYEKDEHYQVDMDLEPGTLLPPTTQAVITELSVLGGNMIDLQYEGNCAGGCLQSGAVIQGRVSNLKGRVAEQAQPILEQVGKFADSLTGPNGMDGALASAYASLNQLRNNTTGLQKSVRAADVPGQASYYRRLSEALLSDRDDLPEDLAGMRDLALQVEAVVGNLAGMTQADIDSLVQIIYTARTALQKVPQQLEGINKNIVGVDQLLDSLELSLQAYQPGATGTVPKLLYDGDFRDSTQVQILRLSDLLEAIRLKPEQYLKF